MKPRISVDDGAAALAAALRHIRAGENPPRAELLTAVRWTLGVLAERYPGNAVEVRVPPAGAVQILTGPSHRRGTPPNVVEMEPNLWLQLAVGDAMWSDAAARISASGVRADLSELLPLPVALPGELP